MKPKDRMAQVFSGNKADRIPFVPTIYEHAAALLGKTPSDLARNEDLLVEGQLKAFDLYRHDLVVVGIDIYNLEAEALGCKVEYYDSADIPGIVSHVLEDGKEKLVNLTVPNPETDGRMPLLLNAASRVHEQIGDEVGVSGSIVGPFTLAALIRGFEKFVYDLMLEPGFAHELLQFTTEISVGFGKAFAKRGLGVAVNESWITPPLLSPKLYEQFVFPRHQEMISRLKANGLGTVGLISGGNTTAISDLLVKTGSSILLADYNTDLKQYKTKSMEAGVVLRGSIDSKLVEAGTPAEITEAADKVLSIGAPGGKFIMGCGVVSYHTKPENLMSFKKAVEEFSNF